MTKEEAIALLEKAVGLDDDVDQVEVFGKTITARLRLASDWLDIDALYQQFGKGAVITDSDWERGCDTCGYGSTCQVEIVLP